MTPERFRGPVATRPALCVGSCDCRGTRTPVTKVEGYMATAPDHGAFLVFQGLFSCCTIVRVEVLSSRHGWHSKGFIRAQQTAADRFVTGTPMHA